MCKFSNFTETLTNAMARMQFTFERQNRPATTRRVSINENCRCSTKPRRPYEEGGVHSNHAQTEPRCRNRGGFPRWADLLRDRKARDVGMHSDRDSPRQPLSSQSSIKRGIGSKRWLQHATSISLSSFMCTIIYTQIFIKVAMFFGLFCSIFSLLIL